MYRPIEFILTFVVSFYIILRFFTYFYRMKKHVLLSASIVFLTLSASAQTTTNIPLRQPVLPQEEIIANIERTIDQVRADWQIPGMGVSIYKDGQVILSKGYGVKDLDSSAPVDDHTLFQIGSVSKSFTAAVIAQLVDEGLLSWEDHVKDLLPDFEMYDPWVTENIQVKDLTSHRTGLRDDIGTYLGNLGYDRDDIYQMFRLMPPAYTFRGDYQYNNITFIPAAKIIEKLTGKSWEDNVRERIFQPLGMNESTLNGEGFGAALEEGTAALPYTFERLGRRMNIWPMYGDEQALWWLTVVGPAGSICCPPADLIKWAVFHLNNGKVGDTQVISERQMNYLHRGVTITSQTPDKTNLYGHCWFIEQTRKCRMYFHTGTTWGMTTICCFIPEMDFAMTIQVNNEAPADARYAVLRRAVDLFLGYEDYDYNAEYLANWYENADRRATAEEKAAAEREEKAAPAWSRIQGSYTPQHEILGGIDILIEDGRLYIQLHNKKAWKRELTHVNGNVFNFRADGHGFDVRFDFENPDEWGSLAKGLSITVGSGEKFANWTKKP